jgi:hypothetical protein
VDQPQPQRLRTGGGGRRAGYVIAAVINLVVWFLANVDPGWQAVWFLSPSAAQLLALFNLVILTQAAANVLYAIFDSTGLKRFLEVPLTVLSLWLAVRVLVVFPFDFGPDGGIWSQIALVMAFIGVLGTAIALIVNIALLVKWVVMREPAASDRREP